MSDRHTHSDAACSRLIGSLLPELKDLVEVATADPRVRAAEVTAATSDIRVARPVSGDVELVQLLGMALWDVFSNNHTVSDEDGITYDLGSFRGSASFIADAISERYTQLGRGFFYLDFYMGSSSSDNQKELHRIYCWIFQHLKAAHCRWRYTFPRIYLIDFGPMREERDVTMYDAGEAVRIDLEYAASAARSRDLEEELDRIHEESLRMARYAPLPLIVLAHREVFGKLPDGWPHRDM